MTPGQIIKTAIAIGLLSVGFYGGCTVQGKLDKGKLERQSHALTIAARDLEDAQKVLRGNAEIFQSISFETKQAAKKAEDNKKLGKSLVEQKAIDNATLTKKLAALEKKLKDEQEECVDGKAKICGVPLE